MQLPDQNPMPRFEPFKRLAQLQHVGECIGRLFYIGEVPMYRSSHYVREDFYDDPLASPSEPVIDWPSAPDIEGRDL